MTSALVLDSLFAGEVQLKPGELTKLDWDDKLTLEFNGSRTCLSA